MRRFGGNPPVGAPTTFAAHIENCLNSTGELTRTITTRGNSNADTARVSDLSYGYSTPTTTGVCPGEPVGKVTSKRQDSTDNLTAVRTQFCTLRLPQIRA